MTTATPSQFSATVSEHDRCDRCNAKAKALVITNSGPLTFCDHHFNKHVVEFNKANYFSTKQRKAGE